MVSQPERRESKAADEKLRESRNSPESMFTNRQEVLTSRSG